MNRCDIGSDGKTPLQRLHGRRDNTPILEDGEKILYMPATPARGGKWEPRFHPGVFVGILNSSSEAVVVTEQGMRSTHARRTSEESLSRRDGTRTRYLEYEPSHRLRRAVTMHLTFRSEWRDPQRVPGDVLMETTAHSEACWRRIEGLLKGDPVWVRTTGCRRQKNQSCTG